jgi:hypothetical protein
MVFKAFFGWEFGGLWRLLRANTILRPVPKSMIMKG